MRLVFGMFVAALPPITLAFGACTSFGAAPAPDAAPNVVASDGGGDVGQTSEAAVDAGPFCRGADPERDGAPRSESYDFCWDFTDALSQEGFDFLNLAREYDAGRSSEHFTSSPAGWYSESRSAGTLQSSARLGQTLGAPKQGTYRLAFDIRLDTSCPDGASVAELYCTRASGGGGAPILRLNPRPTNSELEIEIARAGTGGFAKTGSAKLAVPHLSFFHVEAEVTVGANTAAILRANGRETSVVGEVSCDTDRLQLLIGTQGILPPNTRCVAWYDNVTLIAPP